jgi:PKD repeat protein/V8-like Glu-specific endopeptidase
MQTSAIKVFGKCVLLALTVILFGQLGPSHLHAADADRVAPLASDYRVPGLRSLDSGVAGVLGVSEDSVVSLLSKAQKIDRLSAKPIPMPVWTEPKDSVEDPRNIVAYDIESGEVLVYPFQPGDGSAVTCPTNAYYGDLFGDTLNVANEGDVVNLKNFGDLQQVSNPYLYPWRVNVKVYMTFPSGTYVGSGVLIDPMHVLTAGHCVYNHNDGAWASSVEVIPGYDWGNEPYGSASATTLYSWTGWVSNEDYDWDMGYIKLNRPVGSLTGYHGYSYNSNDGFFSNNVFNNPGYPAESPYNGQEMWTWSGNYDQVYNDLVYFFKYCYGGQSGSGSYFISGDQRTVYAVLSHVKYDLLHLSWKTGHVRITQTKFNSIASTISANTPSSFDLVALDVRAEPQTIKAGEELSSFDYYVHNYSSASYSGTVTVRVYLSTNDIISDNDILIDTRYFTHSFGPKSSARFTASSNLPVIPCDLRNYYYIGIKLDISDYEIANNYSSGDDATRLWIEPPLPPQADFSANVTDGCAPLTVDFTDFSTGCIDTWSWSFGDGGSNSSQNPTYTYYEPGTYTVSLTVTNPEGVDTETKYNYITVREAPVADFSGSPRDGCKPLQVSFIDQSLGDPTSWSWNFGDGGTSTQQNPDHIYQEAGTYTVSLTVSNQCGVDTETKYDYITITDCQLNAEFQATSTEGCESLQTCFQDLSVGNITNWLWSFGDGDTSTVQNPCHNYQNPGLYTVTLIVTDGANADTATKVDYIAVYESPVADFMADPKSGCPPCTVQFTDVSSGTVTGWLWDFGDSTTSNQQNPLHIYNNEGLYTVALTVSGPCGKDTIIKSNFIVVSCNNYTIGGRIYYFNMTSMVPDVVVSLSGDTSADDVTDLNGEYLFGPLSSGTYTIRPSKSEDDPCVSVADIIKIRRHLAGLEVFTSCYQYIAADVYQPPSLNVGDIIKLRYYIVGLDSLPSDIWLFCDSSAPCTPDNYWLVPDSMNANVVNQSLYDQSFICIHAGDVNGSWPSPFAASGRNGRHSESASLNLVYIPYIQAPAHSIISIPVIISCSDDIAGFELHLTYDEDAIRLVNLEPGPNITNLTSYGAEGKIHVVWEDIFRKLTAQDSTHIVSLGFEVVSESIDTARIKFEKVVLANSLGRELPVDTRDGLVTCLGLGTAEQDVRSSFPKQVQLVQNFPNPFNVRTTIQFTLASPDRAQLCVYNLLGQKIRMLVDGFLQEGSHQVIWDGLDDRGKEVASGIYLYRLKTGESLICKRMVLLK